MKARYLDQLHLGHDVRGATGAPLFRPGVQGQRNGGEQRGHLAADRRKRARRADGDQLTVKPATKSPWITKVLRGFPFLFAQTSKVRELLRSRWELKSSCQLILAADDPGSPGAAALLPNFWRCLRVAHTSAATSTAIANEQAAARTTLLKPPAARRWPMGWAQRRPAKARCAASWNPIDAPLT